MSHAAQTAAYDPIVSIHIGPLSISPHGIFTALGVLAGAVLPLLDLAAPWSTLGIAIGRIGDLIIADHLGDPTSLPFGFRCPDIVDVGRTVGSSCPPGEVVHLTAAYDLLLAAAITLAVLAVQRRTTRTGTAIATVGILYGADRLLLDNFRADATRLGLTGSQWTGLLLVAAGIGLLAWARSRPADRQHPEPTAADSS